MTDDRGVAQFARDLAQLIEDHGFTRRSLAARVRYDHATISRACSGHRLPSPDVLRRIVEACGESPDLWLERRSALVRRMQSSISAAPFANSEASTNPLLTHGSMLGLQDVYPDRDSAMAAFRQVIQDELRPNGRLWIFGSTLRGVKLAGDVGAAVQHLHCQVRVLCTHPRYAEDRAEDEGRPFGSIPEELRVSLRELRFHDVTSDHVRLVRATPTLFGICATDRMLINPYPFGIEAYRGPTFIVRKTSETSPGIFEFYEKHHFEKAWDRGEAVPDDIWKAAVPQKRQPRTPEIEPAPGAPAA